jgi:hypothetical protein
VDVWTVPLHQIYDGASTERLLQTTAPSRSHVLTRSLFVPNVWNSQQQRGSSWRIWLEPNRMKNVPRLTLYRRPHTIWNQSRWGAKAYGAFVKAQQEKQRKKRDYYRASLYVYEDITVFESAYCDKSYSYDSHVVPVFSIDFSTSK